MGKELKEKFREKALMNKFVLSAWTVTVIIICAAYLLEVIKGERTVPYYAMVVLIGLIPVLIGQLLYKKDDENQKIRYWAAFGYSVIYAFVLITGDTVMTFVYIFPLLAALLAYSDQKLLRNFGIINFSVNVISVVYKIVVLGMNSNDNIADYEIQLFDVLLVMVLAYFASKLNAKINEDKMQTIEENQKRQQEVLEAVLNSTRVLSEKVADVDSHAKEVEKKSSSAQNSIEEIANGTADVADNVQIQLGMSNGISKELENLTKVSEDIQIRFGETRSMSEAGIANVENLSESTSMVEASKTQVESATDSLLKEIQEAKEILSLIHSITEQTNLLSLNASIEAARVGEQGKGFAVVAGEIQKLSGDTGEATDRINGILEALSEEADRVNAAVNNLGEVSGRQNELIQATDEQFHQINDNISAMSEGIASQGAVLSEINNNNNDIAGSISSTSAFTEELTASSENTMNMTKESLEGTQSIAQLLDEILTEVQSLEATMHQK